MAAPARTYQRSGRHNVVALGSQRSLSRDLYHFLLSMPWSVFFALILGTYLVSNCLFALLYMTVGGIDNADAGSFADMFFFSVQTMATIGYGRMVPASSAANMLVAIEALAGLLGLAMATSLSYARFSRPMARVIFSRAMVVSRNQGKLTLMFRIANERLNASIVEARLRVSMLRNEVTAEGERFRRGVDLPLVRAHFAVFALTWTVMHVIDEQSPLFGATRESLQEREAEIVVALTGLDELLMQTVHVRTSYAPEEIVWNARLTDILGVLPDGRRSVDYARFHDVVPESDSAMR